MSRSAAIAVSAVLTTAMSSISIAVAAQTTVSVQRCVAVIGRPGRRRRTYAAWSWAKCENARGGRPVSAWTALVVRAIVPARYARKIAMMARR